MAFLASFLKPGFFIKIASCLAVGGIIYLTLTQNAELRSKLRDANEQVDTLRLAREKDAIAAKRYIEAVEREKAQLREALDQLEDISDEEALDYLDAPVPDSVRRLLNP